MSTFPYAKDSLSTNRTDATVSATTHAADHNAVNDAVNKVQDYLLASPFNAQTGTSYTLVDDDNAVIVSMSNAAANTLTVPPNASVAFPVGTQIIVRQGGAGTTTIAPGSGVTVNSRGGVLSLAGQYAYATLIKTATNTWDLTGDIV